MHDDMPDEDLIRQLADQALQRSAGRQGDKVSLQELVQRFTEGWGSITGVRDLNADLGKVRSMLAEYQPSIWASVLHQASEGGRYSNDARRYLFAALYGWGLGVVGDGDKELVEKARRALSLMEQHELVEEHELAATVAKWLEGYALRNPHKAARIVGLMPSLTTVASDGSQ